MLEGSRLITVFGQYPETRTGLAVAILMQTVLRRYTTTTQTFGYLNAPTVFDKLYTHKFGDVDEFEQSLSEPALLILANVDELGDPQYPYFLKCVAERCDRGAVTIFTTTRYCMNDMMRQHETIKHRMSGGRVVKAV